MFRQVRHPLCSMRSVKAEGLDGACSQTSDQVVNYPENSAKSKLRNKKKHKQF